MALESVVGMMAVSKGALLTRSEATPDSRPTINVALYFRVKQQLASQFVSWIWLLQGISQFGHFHPMSSSYHAYSSFGHI